MKSFVNVTEQIDDLSIAVEELLVNATPDALLKNTVGILYCYSDMETSDLASVLSQKANFPIVGCTTIASMEHIRGMHDMAATLMVITADDCTFAPAVSEPITPQNVGEQLDRTCRYIRQTLGEEPQLIFALPPYILEIMLDEYASGFNRGFPGVPVVGGLPSYNATGDRNLTIFGKETYSDRMVLFGASGNLRPVFSVNNVTTIDVDRKRKVTMAKNNIIYRVGEQTFTDYLREIGLPVESLTHGNTTITFVSNPLLLESAKDGFSFVRTLHEINLEEGSGTAIGRIPMDATVSICSLQRREIEQAAAAGFRILKEKMSAAVNKSSGDGEHASSCGDSGSDRSNAADVSSCGGSGSGCGNAADASSGESGSDRSNDADADASEYKYTTVFAVSCIGRHLLMSPNNDAEVNSLLTEFPDNLALSGFYSYGELGPQGATQTQNFAHNESLILCAI